MHLRQINSIAGTPGRLTCDCIFLSLSVLLLYSTPHRLDRVAFFFSYCRPRLSRELSYSAITTRENFLHEKRGQGNGVKQDGHRFISICLFCLPTVSLGIGMFMKKGYWMQQDHNSQTPNVLMAMWSTDVIYTGVLIIVMLLMTDVDEF